MQNVRSQLPPMDTLATFEAAARLQSFTLAGEELNITQAAVSRQIRILEESLNTRLFHRRHRAIALTPEGKSFYSTVTLALSHIASATGELRGRPETRQLCIAADQSIGWLWLMPRLPRFRKAFPAINVRLVVSDNKADCVADDVDVAIAFGPDDWPGFRSGLLFREQIFPVCSPGYLAGRPQAAAELLASSTLLELEDEQWGWVNWRVWLTAVGLADTVSGESMRINNYPLILESARNGMGIALGWKTLTDELVERGDLVRPLDLDYQSSSGYYLLVRESSTQKPGADAFTEWAFSEMPSGGALDESTYFTGTSPHREVTGSGAAE